MANGIFPDIAVLKVGDILVPIIRHEPARIGTFEERLICCEVQLGLEGECLVSDLIALGSSPVDEEDRPRDPTPNAPRHDQRAQNTPCRGQNDECANDPHDQPREISY